MREILFRGKRVDNGEYMPGSYGDWVYGSYGLKLNVATGKDEEYIMESVYNGATNSSYFVDYKIIPETAGQYTGIKDKNGKGIYEGDIIRFIKENCLVIFVENDCAFRIEVDGRISTALRKAHSKDYEVIGNIHDEEEDDEV